MVIELLRYCEKKNTLNKLIFRVYEVTEIWGQYDESGRGVNGDSTISSL